MCNDTIFLNILINTCLLETRHKPYILLCEYYTIENKNKKYLNIIKIDESHLSVKS